MPVLLTTPRSDISPLLVPLFNVKKLLAGDIGATVKLKNTKTNNTLNEKKSSLCIEPIAFPEPKYRIAIKAKNEADDEKLSEVLYRMHEEDPTFTIEYSKESNTHGLYWPNFKI